MTVDWTPLNRVSDPVPGDPTVVASGGRHYVGVADAINTAGTNLKRMADDAQYDSDAVRAFQEKARDISDDIFLAEDRYRGVGEALNAYAPELEYAQDEARAALTEAEDAAEEARQERIEAMEAEENDDEPEETDEEPPSAGMMRAALTRLENAISHRDEHATVAKNKINAAMEDTENLNDSTWDNIAGFLQDLVKIADLVAAVAGILAMLVGWIPVVGYALAAVLGTIALVAGIVSLVGNLALAIGDKGSWGDVLWSVAGLVGGKLAKGVFKGAKGALKGGAVLRGNTAVFRGVSAPLRNRAATRLAAGTGLRGIRSGFGNLARSAKPGSMWASVRTGFRNFSGNMRTVFSQSNWSAARHGFDARFAAYGQDLQNYGDIYATLKQMGKTQTLDDILELSNLRLSDISDLRGIYNLSLFGGSGGYLMYKEYKDIVNNFDTVSELSSQDPTSLNLDGPRDFGSNGVATAGLPPRQEAQA